MKRPAATWIAAPAILAYAITVIVYACHGNLLALLLGVASFPYAVWRALEVIRPD